LADLIIEESELEVRNGKFLCPSCKNEMRESKEMKGALECPTCLDKMKKLGIIKG